MMGNSVLDTLDLEDEVNELRLFISGYRSGKKFTVLVEGIDDVKTYEKFFARDKVEVHQTSGCCKLVELVKGLDAMHLEDYFIGIKDADYDKLNQVAYPYSNLFLTDTHDLETMMVDGDIVETIMKENLRYEDVKRDKVDLAVCSFLENVLCVLKSLSYIRWYNDVNDSHINFDVCKIPEMLKINSALGYDCCVYFLTRHPENAATQLAVSEFQSFEAAHSQDVDLLLLVRGHDMCEVTSALLQQHPYYRKSSKLSCAKVEQALRLGYSKEAFRNTQLYASIDNWFQERGYVGMLAC